MSILQKQKERDPAHGLRARFRRRDGERAAGGGRARRARHRQRRRRESVGVRAGRAGASRAKRGAAGKLQIGVVTGDDLLPRLDELHRAAATRSPTWTRASRSTTVRDRVLSANAYIGSAPIVEALARGANIVITGPLDRHRAHDGAAAPRVRLGRRRLGPARRRHHRRAHHRVRRAVLRRQLPVRLARHSRPRERRLSDRRGRADGIVRRHEASGHRRPRHRAVGHRAARLRDGRPAALHHAGRRRRLHHRSSSTPTARTACACSASRAGRRRTS